MRNTNIQRCVRNMLVRESRQHAACDDVYYSCPAVMADLAYAKEDDDILGEKTYR